MYSFPRVRETRGISGPILHRLRPQFEVRDRGLKTRKVASSTEEGVVRTSHSLGSGPVSVSSRPCEKSYLGGYRHL